MKQRKFCDALELIQLNEDIMLQTAPAILVMWKEKLLSISDYDFDESSKPLRSNQKRMNPDTKLTQSLTDMFIHANSELDSVDDKWSNPGQAEKAARLAQEVLSSISGTLPGPELWAKVWKAQ